MASAGKKSKPKDEFTATKTAYEALLGLKPDEIARAIRVISEKHGVSPVTASGPGPGAGAGSGPGHHPEPTRNHHSNQTPRQFLTAKKPRTAVEQVACL